ncbi:uncharacterized protein LOC128230082 isoform X2 [Mya arenaria]|uniref:uncharacterized protein LOC128230082 isoform X2 n=1 Tax=Mya arenaria TaxID=6604 RepID=UPI0022E42874|nr:uncharacterized protein LOC128230082 isoform X2 [Mya arenaria]
MAGSGIEHYLFDIVQSDSVNTMAKLAALSVLKSMIEKDSKLQDKCLEKECVTVLMAALETGLEENDDPSHIVYISVAMEIIFILSQRPICSIQTLVTEEVIRMFLEYVNPSGQFYMFPNNLKQVLADLCEKKHMIGKVKVVTMATEPIEYIHRHTKNKFKRFQCIPDKLKVCDVYNTEGETDVCITDHLIHNHRAWPGAFPFDSSSNDPDDQWKDILVTQVLDGGMFWAQVGESCIKKVIMIQQELNNGHPLVKRHLPRGGHVVAVETNILGETCFIRAQVMSLGVSSLEMFAVDYGYVLRVPEAAIYSLPDSLSLKSQPRKISLCALSGIAPAPYDESLTQNALAILANLCRQSLPAGQMFGSMDGLAILKQVLVGSPCVPVRTQALTLLHNLTTNYRLAETITQLDFIQILLGLELILQIIRSVSTKNMLYTMATKLLKVFVGRATLSMSHSRDFGRQNSGPEASGQAVHKSSTQSSLDEQDEYFEDSDIEEDFTSSLEHAGSQSGGDLKYVLGQRMRIEDDDTHELYSSKKAKDIKREELAKHVCGMLNRGFGGTIYCGLGKDSQVLGLELSRDEKDQFRLGIDQMMVDWIEPVLFHSQFEFSACPVYDPNTQELIQDLFVIEIQVKSSIGCVYMIKNGGCYWRYEGSTVLISRQELRQIVSLEEERIYNAEIRRLQAIKDRLVQKLTVK